MDRAAEIEAALDALTILLAEWAAIEDREAAEAVINAETAPTDMNGAVDR